METCRGGSWSCRWGWGCEGQVVVGGVLPKLEWRSMSLDDDRPDRFYPSRACWVDDPVKAQSALASGVLTG
jgi:hypothetical protein